MESQEAHRQNRRLRTSLMFCTLMFAMTIPTSAADEPEKSTDRATLLQVFHKEFVPINVGTKEFPATFLMGTNDGQPAEAPPHKVTIARPFSIAKYEVPQNLYAAVMGSNPSRWQGPRNSAERMSWIDAIAFCEKVTTLLREQKLIDETQVVRLPTEAEWEYACRAGTTTAYSFGDMAQQPGDIGNKASLLDPYAWHTGNAAGNDPEVGVLKPNPWGLYDMHGYLSEFTVDRWHDNYAPASNITPPTDGSAWETPKLPIAAGSEIPQCVLRGGSWKHNHLDLRSTSRQPLPITSKSDAIGLRCVLTASNQ
ncbi:MAG: formylglycine-generating enzyme family protein [Planctomycetaceae bacterium]